MKRILLSILAAIMALEMTGQVTLSNLTVENLQNPLGLDESRPRLSWQINSTKRNVLQTAYEIRVSDNAATLSKGGVWSSGKVESDQSVHVAFGGQELKPKTRYHWQVRVWDNSGKPSAWSEVGWWESGLMNPAGWKAFFIESGLAGDEVGGPAPHFRKKFQLAKSVQSARMYVTAHGIYEAWLNGQRVGDAYLTPGWTSYKTRLQYQVYDVTRQVKAGDNAVGATVGDGWFRGHLAWRDNKNIYGNKVALLLQMEVTYTDGTTETIISDSSWKSSFGPIRMSEIYHGEVYDAREEKTGWTGAAYDDSKWQAARQATTTKGHVIASESPPIRKREVLNPVKVFKTPKGETVIDFGQNLTGWIRMTAAGKAGDKVTVHHAEVLDKEGNFYITNLRAARAEIVYTLKGGGEESYEPHFTFFGFRYIRVEGFPGEVTAKNFQAIALYSDMRVTGNFECSNPLVNQLQKNIQWGQRGNFLDVPTDCPQRDERLGWTGDAQAFSRCAAFNMDVEQFFAKWLKDVAADQNAEGAVPFVVPHVLEPQAVASAGWADAATIIPWNMYVLYGDKKILEQQYESMKKWVSYMQTKSKNDLWNTGFHFGDWLFYLKDDDRDGLSAITDKYLIAQTFYAHSVQLVVNAARVLGKKEDEEKYTVLLQRVKDAFNKEYVTANGRLVSSTQTAYVLALNFDMLPESQRAQAAAKLASNVKSYNNHITTGFLGTPYICHVLTRFGYTDVAYDLLMQETYPSWLYPVKMGATTIWERWDGIKPDSTFQTPAMNSFNHYAYGAVGDWMYRVITGIDPSVDGPGYKKVVIKPQAGGKLTYAKAELQTHYGKVASRWKVESGRTLYDFEIPVNTTADIVLPAKSTEQVTESGKPVSSIKEIRVMATEGNSIVLTAGSGTYHIVVAN